LARLRYPCRINDIPPHGTPWAATGINDLPIATRQVPLADSPFSDTGMVAAAQKYLQPVVAFDVEFAKQSSRDAVRCGAAFSKTRGCATE
jgi:hypothetical protein